MSDMKKKMETGAELGVEDGGASPGPDRPTGPMIGGGGGGPGGRGGSPNSISRVVEIEVPRLEEATDAREPITVTVEISGEPPHSIDTTVSADVDALPEKEYSVVVDLIKHLA